jgi:hypothetical protein
MPHSTRIAGSDKPIGAPLDWDEAVNGHCGGLFIRREEISGIAFMRSAWVYEHHEALMLLAGANAILGIAGRGQHPVVHLAVDSLPPEFEPVLTACRITTPKGIAAVRVEMLFCFGGGRRGYSIVELKPGQSYPDAVAEGATQIEALAKKEGWVE